MIFFPLKETKLFTLSTKLLFGKQPFGMIVMTTIHWLFIHEGNTCRGRSIKTKDRNKKNVAKRNKVKKIFL